MELTDLEERKGRREITVGNGIELVRPVFVGAAVGATVSAAPRRRGRTSSNFSRVSMRAFTAAVEAWLS